MIRRVLDGRVVVPLALLGVVMRRWYQLGPYPPGVDEGHWLALGRAYVGQESDVTRLFSRFAMPPAVPVLLSGLSELVGPFEASRLAAAASIGATMLAVYGVTYKRAGSWLAGLASTLLGFSILVVDPAAWGGYPQNFALAALVCASYFLGQVLSHRRGVRWLVLSTLLVALTHHAFYGVLAAVSIAVTALWLLDGRPNRFHCRRLALALACYVPSGLVFALVLVSLERSGYEPAVNAGSATFAGTLNYVTPAPRMWWYAVALLAIFSLAGTIHARRSSEWRSAMSLVSVGSAAFFVTIEPRFLSVAAAGLAIALALGWGELGARLAPSAPWRSGLVYGGAAFLVVVLFPVSDQRAESAFVWFATVDESYSEVARWIDEQPDDGAIAMRTDNRGWPVGWWLRGLTSKQVLVGSDETWLGFPSEVRDASLVARLFAEDEPQSAIVEFARSQDIAFLVFRSDQWYGWERWSIPGHGMRLAFANTRYTVIEID